MDRYCQLPMGIRKFLSVTFFCSLSAVFVIAILLVSGCTTRYLPQPTDRIRVIDGHALLQEEGLTLAVAARAWTKEPQKLADYFTTFHITVINQSNSTLLVTMDDFKLLDQERNQYDVQSIDDVASIFVWDDMYFDRFAPFGERSERTSVFDRTDRTLARANLMQEAFQFGEIMPGARKTGFIFFNRVPSRNRVSTIIFRNNEIVFERS